MEQAWLDSLSEDWVSQPRSSGSPAPSLPSTSNGTYESCIPKYNPSQKTWAVGQDSSTNALVERSPSENNIPASQRVLRRPSKLRDDVSYSGQRRHLSRSLSASAAPSVHGQAIQYYGSVNISPNRVPHDTPEWRRRLLHGDVAYGEQRDLFSPVGLEGIFRPPPVQPAASTKLPTDAFENGNITMPSSPPPYSKDFGSQRSGLKISSAEHIQEKVDGQQPQAMKYDLMEMEGSEFSANDLSRSSNFRPVAVISQEDNSPTFSDTFSNSGNFVPQQNESVNGATRVVSGQSDTRNEALSPIYITQHNTIAKEVEHYALDLSANKLQSRLKEVQGDGRQRHIEDSSQAPEGNTVDTDDYAHNGRFINIHRGGCSQEGSFRRRMLSPSSPQPMDESVLLPEESMQASTPKQLPNMKKTRASNEFFTSQPTQDSYPVPPAPHPSPVKSNEVDPKSTSGSPLKIFGTYDTFTNQMLLRRLSQFEEHFDNDDEMPSALGQESTHSGVNEAFVENSSPGKGLQHNNERRETSRKLNSFGRGDLDNFQFNEDISYSSSKVSSEQEDKENISLPALDHGPAGLKFHLQPSPALEEGLVSQRRTNHPTPKRRRTLQKNDISRASDENGEGDELQQNQHRIHSVIGKKRKDAKHEDDVQAANPKVLATRQILRPRTPTPSQRSSLRFERAMPQEVDLDEVQLKLQEEKIARIQAELDSTDLRKPHTTLGMSQQAQDGSRKGSVTTQDFLDEAKKIMAGIRGKARPRSGLNSLEESESDNDRKVLSGTSTQEEFEDSYQESSQEPFSRPPSRDGRPVPRPPTKQQDPDVLNHLRKYEEMSDMDEVIATSIRSIAMAKNAAKSVKEINRITEEMISRSPAALLGQGGGIESDPPNIRITENPELQRKRKHSSSSEEDPFGDIPDLSVDETQELQRLKAVAAKRKEEGQAAHNAANAASNSQDVANTGTNPITNSIGVNARPDDEPSSEPSKFTQLASSITNAETNTRITSWGDDRLPIRLASKSGAFQTENFSKLEVREELAEEVEKEISIYEDRVKTSSPQRRNVTISFSSPLTSIIQTSAYDEGLQFENELDDSLQPDNDDYEDVGGGNAVVSKRRSASMSMKLGTLRKSSRHLSLSDGGFVARPVSRIDEQDEETFAAESDERRRRSVSIVVATPLPPRTVARPPHEIGTLELTPLSDFTVHHGNESFGLEVSYIERGNRYTLGDSTKRALSLSIKDIVARLTEVEPYEPFWEHIKKMDLKGKNLTSLHKLEEFCGRLEELDVSDNRISQLNGAPSTIRQLRIAHNNLSDLTAWGHLSNLQYIDVSNNEIESLSAFKYLVHLRGLRADNNRIKSLDGIRSLDGLLSLRLRGNLIESVDFNDTKLQRLSDLDLNGNQIIEVRNMHLLSSLSSLSLENNYISTIESDCSQEQWALKYLKLCGNNLEFIDISQYPNLRLLYLDRNRLGKVTGLHRTKRLDSLSMREQQEGSIIDHSVLAEAFEVRKLFLSGNFLGTFEPPIDFLNLQYLELANCGLESLPVEFGQIFPNIRVLNLNFNALKDVRPLLGITRLKKLYLAGNRLLRLRTITNVLAQFPTLTQVDIRSNPLTQGFYPPVIETRLVPHETSETDGVVCEPFFIGPADADKDKKYASRLDMETKMLRRVYEMLVLGRSEHIKVLDGLRVDISIAIAKDEITGALVRAGIVQAESTGTVGENNPERSQAEAGGANEEGTIEGAAPKESTSLQAW
ncbi:hypothetical protein OIDMADRAFT_122393 [Oidiodendron maius Zn]|uniref:Septation initiation network scaffold protein cdc11 n=1 Tax=Oidiodendron maius (strain Zn) TaxID=913774 RepID=A0A0C3DH72_OIDMZ|nr:hypothetical protein OIDMADRAFT_122393 [Oidiodendron maius Zn]